MRDLMALTTGRGTVRAPSEKRPVRARWEPERFVTIILNMDEMRDIRRIARRRNALARREETALFEGAPTGDMTHIMGKMAERAVAIHYRSLGWETEEPEVYGQSDDGADVILIPPHNGEKRIAAQVKSTSPRGENLIIEQKFHKSADVFFLCRCDADTGIVLILGWEYGGVVERHPPQKELDTGSQVVRFRTPCKVIHASALRVLDGAHGYRR